MTVSRRAPCPKMIVPLYDSTYMWRYVSSITFPATPGEKDRGTKESTDKAWSWPCRGSVRRRDRAEDMAKGSQAWPLSYSFTHPPFLSVSLPLRSSSIWSCYLTQHWWLLCVCIFASICAPICVWMRACRPAIFSSLCSVPQNIILATIEVCNSEHRGVFSAWTKNKDEKR